MPAASCVPTRADYGIDAPRVVLLFFILGDFAIALGVLARILFGPRQPFFFIGLCVGVSWLLTSAVMIWGSKLGKVRLRERILDGMGLRGDEQVLDVGCGRGLMLIGAAKRLPRGKAVGVDLWQTEDQLGNSPEATLQNARAEGVADRVEIKTGDARQLPFEAGWFDAVVSSWALHNIYDSAGREKAVREIVRVLKAGGRLAVVDIRHTAEYARVLRQCGLSEVKRSGPNFLFVIPSFVVSARKAPKR